MRVAGVGDDKALVVLGLEAGLLGLDGGYLVEALRYVYNLRGKCSFREALRNLRIEPDGLMEKYGNDALVAEVDVLRHDAGHSEGMLDEGVGCSMKGWRFSRSLSFIASSAIR